MPKMPKVPAWTEIWTEKPCWPYEYSQNLVSQTTTGTEEKEREAYLMLLVLNESCTCRNNDANNRTDFLWEYQVEKMQQEQTGKYSWGIQEGWRWRWKGKAVLEEQWQRWDGILGVKEENETRGSVRERVKIIEGLRQLRSFMLGAVQRKQDSLHARVYAPRMDVKNEFTQYWVMFSHYCALRSHWDRKWHQVKQIPSETLYPLLQHTGLRRAETMESRKGSEKVLAWSQQHDIQWWLVLSLLLSFCWRPEHCCFQVSLKRISKCSRQ